MFLKRAMGCWVIRSDENEALEDEVFSSYNIYQIFLYFIFIQFDAFLFSRGESFGL